LEPAKVRTAVKLAGSAETFQQTPVRTSTTTLNTRSGRPARFALCGLVAKNKGYPSDLTDAQWELIEPLVPTPQGGWPSGDAFAAPDRGLGPVKWLLGAQIDA